MADEDNRDQPGSAAEQAAQVVAAQAAASANVAAEAADATIAAAHTAAAQVEANAADAVRLANEEATRWRTEVETRFDQRLAESSSALTAQIEATNRSLTEQLSSILQRLPPQPDPPPNQPQSEARAEQDPAQARPPAPPEPPPPERRRVHRWT